jgi:hypothetical protein
MDIRLRDKKLSGVVRFSLRPLSGNKVAPLSAVVTEMKFTVITFSSANGYLVKEPVEHRWGKRMERATSM